MTPLVVLVGLVLGVAVAALVLAALLAAWVWHVHRVVTAAAELAEACDRDLALAEGHLVAVQRALDGEPLGPDDPDGGEPMPRPGGRVVPLRPHGGSAA